MVGYPLVMTDIAIVSMTQLTWCEFSLENGDVPYIIVLVSQKLIYNRVLLWCIVMLYALVTLACGNQHWPLNISKDIKISKLFYSCRFGLSFKKLAVPYSKKNTFEILKRETPGKVSLNNRKNGWTLDGNKLSMYVYIYIYVDGSPMALPSGKHGTLSSLIYLWFDWWFSSSPRVTWIMSCQTDSMADWDWDLHLLSAQLAEATR